MPIELTKLLQHANTVVGSGDQDQSIYIKQDGSISKDSGLAHIKRPSSEQKRTENQATLEAFKKALIDENPVYDNLLTGDNADKDLVNFFTTKHQQGTPLTARDVQMVKGLMDMAYATTIGKTLVGANMLHGLDATGFAWFCMGSGLKLDSTDQRRDALKQFYTENYCSETVTTALRSSGIPEDALPMAKALLLKSEAFKEAMNRAFKNDLTDVTWETIIADLGKELGPVCKTMVDLIKTKPEAANRLFTSLNNTPGREGVPMFDGFMKIVQGGGLPEADKAIFFHKCRDEHTNLTTPEAQSSALRSFLVEQHSGEIMEDFAVSNGMPKQLGTNLAHLPPLKALIQRELSDIVAPPTVPTQAQIEQAIDRAGSIFLADKGEAIQKILNMSKLTTEDIKDNPILAQLTTKPLEGGQLVSQERLLEMVNALLYSGPLLDKLLDPDSGPDLDLIRAFQDFQDGLESCQHTVPGTYGGPELTDLSMDAMLLMMVPHGSKPEDMEELLLSVNANLRPISMGMESLREGLTNGTIDGPNRLGVAADLPYLQNAMRKFISFTHEMVSTERKTELGIETDDIKFINGMELIDKKPQPLNEIHQAVRDYAMGLGINMRRVGYKENRPLAISVTNAFTGSPENPRLTPLFIQRSAVIIAELGLEGLDPTDLDPVVIGSLMQRALNSNALSRLTETQAREIAEGIIRKTLEEYKPTLEFINGLPTEPVPEDPGAFVVSAEEKAMLLSIIPGSPLRDPELIKAVLLESRSMDYHFKKLTLPGMNVEDMAKSVMEISSMHFARIGKLELPKTSEDQRYGALPVAIQLLLANQNLIPAQKRALYNLVSGDEGKKLGGASIGMASVCQLSKENINKLQDKLAGLLGTVTVMDNIRLILGKELELDPEMNPLYYEEIEPRNISPGIIKDMESVFRLDSKELPGYEALNMLSMPLSKAQWNALMPMMDMISKGISTSFECGIILRMVASNAPELLAAQAGKGRELTPADIWEVVIGGKPPKGLKAENLGMSMFNHATAALLKLGTQTSQVAPESMELVIMGTLGLGVPFKTLLANVKPGGELTLDDVRFKDNFRLSSLENYQENTAYGLTTDFPRRKNEPVTNLPSMVLIQPDGGHPTAYLHLRVSEEDNKPELQLYQDIIDKCQDISDSDLQFRRVMQCLSQASTINMRILSELLPGQSLGEHDHTITQVKAQPNGDVLVEIDRGEHTRPLGGRMKILVAPDGKVTMQELRVQFK